MTTDIELDRRYLRSIRRIVEVDANISDHIRSNPDVHGRLQPANPIDRDILEAAQFFYNTAKVIVAYALNLLSVSNLRTLNAIECGLHNLSGYGIHCEFASHHADIVDAYEIGGIVVHLLYLDDEIGKVENLLRFMYDAHILLDSG